MPAKTSAQQHSGKSKLKLKSQPRTEIEQSEDETHKQPEQIGDQEKKT